MRIVSICPSNTEILAYLGVAEQIVGVDNYSDWPTHINKLPRLGPDLDIDMDAVEQLKPDLVVASLSVPGMEKNIERLKDRNLPFIVLNPNSLKEIGENILTLGEAIGVKKKAQEVSDKYHAFIEQYEGYSRRVTQKPKLYWEWWAKPVFTPGGTNWLTDISQLAGACNVFATEPMASVQTTWEEVEKRDPDLICLVWVGVRKEWVKPQIVYKRPGWEKLAAIRNNKVLVLDEPLYCRPSPRLLTGLKKIASILHPQVYPVYHEGEDWVE